MQTINETMDSLVDNFPIDRSRLEREIDLSVDDFCSFDMQHLPANHSTIFDARLRRSIVTAKIPQRRFDDRDKEKYEEFQTHVCGRV